MLRIVTIVPLPIEINVKQFIILSFHLSNVAGIVLLHKFMVCNWVKCMSVWTVVFRFWRRNI